MAISGCGGALSDVCFGDLIVEGWWCVFAATDETADLAGDGPHARHVVGAYVRRSGGGRLLYYDVNRSTTSLSPVGGGVPITRSGSESQVQICYSGGAVNEVVIGAGFDYALGGISVYIVAPEWKIANAGSQKPVATLKVNTGETGGGGVVVLPGGAYGNMQAGTTATFGIGNNGNLTIRLDGKACAYDGNCFKFKTEIKAYYDADYDVCTTAMTCK